MTSHADGAKLALRSVRVLIGSMIEQGGARFRDARFHNSYFLKFQLSNGHRISHIRHSAATEALVKFASLPWRSMLIGGCGPKSQC